MKKIPFALALALLLSLVMGACGASDPQETTEETKNIMQKTNPAEDDTMNILMVGNSFCYYFADELYGLFKEQFPQTQLYWHQIWAYQVAFHNDNYSVDAGEQAAYHERQREYALGVCRENGVNRIPSGDAWKLVRDGGYDNLCARLAKNNGVGDYYHDGDIGGGQYLNACVWLEVHTGQSCVGNAFRPDYELSEDLITTFQNAAHQAVENMKAGK